MLWHEHRQSLTERVRERRGGRKGTEGKESVSFLSVRAKENKAHQRDPDSYQRMFPDLLTRALPRK